MLLLISSKKSNTSQMLRVKNHPKSPKTNWYANFNIIRDETCIYWIQYLTWNETALPIGARTPSTTPLLLERVEHIEHHLIFGLTCTQLCQSHPSPAGSETPQFQGARERCSCLIWSSLYMFLSTNAKNQKKVFLIFQQKNAMQIEMSPISSSIWISSR